MILQWQIVFKIDLNFKCIYLPFLNGLIRLMFTNTREVCVLSILRLENPVSTRRITELASTAEFQEICRDCRSGTEVYETTMRMHRVGLLNREPSSGGFLWSLANSQT